MMFVATSRALIPRQSAAAAATRVASGASRRTFLATGSSNAGGTTRGASNAIVAMGAASFAVAVTAAAAAATSSSTTTESTSTFAAPFHSLLMTLATPTITGCAAHPVVPTSGDVVSVGRLTKEPATGIVFPALCNGMSLAGVGVRIKYVFVKVYAVGTYLDPIAMMAVEKGTPADIEAALLDPTYPRTIRIVMNRGLSVDKFISAIVEAIQPRLGGRDLQLLDEFKKLFPAVDLVEGAEVEMTIRGDTLLLKNSVGGVGSIRSRAFTEAMCDVYYGKDPVSPAMKDDLMKNIPKL